MTRELSDDQIVGLAADGFIVNGSEIIRLGQMVKRLRVQLGCVKALATLWDEGATEMENYPYPGTIKDRMKIRAETQRNHVEAIRDILRDATE